MRNKINVYICPVCHGNTVTIDRDEGVTPFLLDCRASGETGKCKGMAQSSFYQAFHPMPEPAWEWYKPTDPVELSKMSKAMLIHVAQGGLQIRRINKPLEPNHDLA